MWSSVPPRQHIPGGDDPCGPDDWGYAGEYLEPASGLIYLRARWYDPVDGRFLTKDRWPGDIFHPQSLNGWSYVEGNPVNRVDPSGYCWGPVASLRNVPGYDTLCGNLDMAIFIAGNPNATAAERAFAVEYVELAVWSHVALVAGLTALGYGWMLEGLGAANQTYDIPDQ